MGRDTSNAAMSNSNTAQGMSGTYAGRAAQNYNVLTPTLNQMATAPQGYGANTVAKMNTSALQSVGGAQAGEVGAANNMAARTNNTGGFQSGMTSAAHDATGALSDAALGVQMQDAQLKQAQQQSALGMLNQQYGENTGASQNALGISNQALGVKNAADQQTFDQWFKPFAVIAGNATAAGNAAMGHP